MKKKHTDELLAVSTANDGLCAERDAAVAAQVAMQAERDEACSARDDFRKDRDEHIAKYEELEKRSYEETTRLRRRAKGFCDTMEEMDTLLSGKSLLPPTASFDCWLLSVLTLVFPFELQRPGPSPKKLLMLLLPELEKRRLLPEAPCKRRPTSGPGMST